jgi:hypothetical protein
MSGERVDISDLSEKVLRGLRNALRKLVETSAANNQELVVGDKDGNFKSVPAKDLLKDLPE